MELILSQITARWLALLDAQDAQGALAVFSVEIVPLILQHLRARFIATYPDARNMGRYPALISLLGYTPDTTILATRFTEAEKLVVLHTAETARFVDDVHAYAGLPANAIATRPFDRNRIEEIGVAMENAIQLLGSTTPIAVEVTGGTKPMGSYMQSAAASCGLDTLYLDYDEYDPKHRKPVPSSIYVRLLRTPVVRPVNNALISEVVGRLAIMRQHLQILAQTQGREGVDPNVAITRLEIEIDQLMARLKRTTST